GLPCRRTRMRAPSSSGTSKVRCGVGIWRGIEGLLIPPRLRGGWPSASEVGWGYTARPKSPTRRAKARHPPRRRGGILPQRLQPELAPPPRYRGDIRFARPDLWREPRAPKIRVRVVVEIHGGVDQHPVPLAGTEQCRIAVTAASRGVKPGPEGRRH